MAYLEEEMRWETTTGANGESMRVRIPDMVGYWTKDSFYQQVFVTDGFQNAAQEIVKNLDNEPLFLKMGRLAVDWSLSMPGKMALAGFGAYEAVSNNLGRGGSLDVLAAIGIAYAATQVQEYIRRPLIGLRHLYQQRRGGYSPAAQSTAKIRKNILDRATGFELRF